MLESDKKKQFIESPGAVAAASGTLAGVGGFIKSGIEKTENFKNPRYMAASLTGGALAGLGGYGIAKALRWDPNERANMVHRIGSGHQNSLSARDELDIIQFGWRSRINDAVIRGRSRATGKANPGEAYFKDAAAKIKANPGEAGARYFKDNRMNAMKQTNMSAREELDTIMFGFVKSGHDALRRAGQARKKLMEIYPKGSNFTATPPPIPASRVKLKQQALRITENQGRSHANPFTFTNTFSAREELETIKFGLFTTGMVVNAASGGKLMKGLDSFLDGGNYAKAAGDKITSLARKGLKNAGKGGPYAYGTKFQSSVIPRAQEAARAAKLQAW